MANPFSVTSDIWSAARPPLARYLPAADIEVTDELLADRSGAATPRIMVFGAYNAGKSTLINALIGGDVAPVADHPETDHVTPYPWRGLFLDDTPGIDAPIEHERVTRAHIEICDLVLFVLATDGTLEEQRTYDEIIKVMQTGKPIRVILNNKSGFRADDPNYLNLRDRLADNLRSAATKAGIADIEALAPIRLVNAASGLRARRENKPMLLAASGLVELEADVLELCKATGKVQMARTVCQRIVKQIDLAMAGLPADDGMQPFRETADAVSAERMRLTAVLNQAAQEAALQFQKDITAAVAKQEPQLGEAAVKKATEMVSRVIDRELRQTQRVFNDMELAFSECSTSTSVASRDSLSVPKARQEDTTGRGFQFTDAAKLLGPALNQLDKKILVDGLMAAKQVFPAAFKGLGPAFFGKVVPFIGPAVQVIVGVKDAYSAHREAQREFEREKDHALAQAQQIVDAGSKMRWRLGEYCKDVIEAKFTPVEDALAEQARELKGQAASLEADRATLLRCKGRIEIAVA